MLRPIMANKLTLWRKLGRFLTPAVVLLFFLPFFGVSCEGMEIVSVSGADMVGGCKPGGMINDIAKEEERDPDRGDRPSKLPKIGNVKREPLAIAAMALALIAAGLAWVRSRQALLGAFVVSLLGLGSLIGLYIGATGKLEKAITSQLEKKAGVEDGTVSRGGGLGRLSKDKIDAGARAGFWITCLGFVGVAALAGLALREKEDPDARPASPPAPAPGGSPPPPVS